MAKCQFCDKGVAFGIQVSHSHRRSNRTWKPIFTKQERKSHMRSPLSGAKQFWES